MISIDPQAVLDFWNDLKTKTFTESSCNRQTMEHFGISFAWQVSAMLTTARRQRKQQKDRTRKDRKALERKKHGPPVVTRDQLLADLDMMPDLPRTVRVARVAAYYGLTSTSVNQRIGWNAELSGKSTGAVYEPTAAEIEAAAAKIRESWSDTERAARARWATSGSYEFEPVTMDV